MPIKFRCQHCRQFLGISRAQASSVVDCPTCGRTIRVPDLDGRVKALPKPKIDSKDSVLVKALDAVAAIGNEPADHDSDSQDESDGFDDGDFESNSPAQHEVQAIELEPLPVPEPVELAPVGSPAQLANDGLSAGQSTKAESAAADANPKNEGLNSTAAPGDGWKQLMAAAQAEDLSDEDLKSSVPAAAKSTTSSDSPKPTQTEPQQNSPTTLFAMIGIAAMIFAVGFWLGRVTTINAGPTASNGGTNSNPTNANDANNDGDFNGLDVAIRGRVTYRTETGKRLPDREARVIVLPADWSGAGRLPAAGFQNGAAIQDRRIAIASIREMGGDFCITREDGGFDIKLKSSGQFHVLVLSNSLSREAGDEDEKVEDLASKYFDRSIQLLGQVKYHTELIRYSGDGTEPLDHSFQRT